MSESIRSNVGGRQRRHIQQLLEEALVVAPRPARHYALHLDIPGRQGFQPQSGQGRCLGIDMQRGAVDGGVEQQGIQFQIVLDVLFLLAFFHLVQRRLSDVDVAALDQYRHLAIEKRQQQRADVRAVDVGVGVVAAQATHARDEVLVALDRKIVDVSVTRRNLFDIKDGQRHQIAVDELKISLAATAV